MKHRFTTRKKLELTGLTLAALVFFNCNTLLAGNVYNYIGPTGATWAFVDNVTQWNALFTAGAVQPTDEYVIPSNATIVIGSTNSSHNVDLNATVQNITLNGRLGFRVIGSQQIRLHPSAQVVVSATGRIGFYEVYAPAPGLGVGNWYGNTSEQIVFGSTPVTDPFIQGPWFVIGPETINISDAAVGGAAAPVSRIWIGGPGLNGSDWIVAANWLPLPGSGPSVPLATDNVIIPASAVQFPEIQSGNVTTHDLVLESGAAMSVGFSSSLTVTGNIYNIGTINVQSGGALVQTTGATLVTSDGTSTGSFVIERDLSGQVSPWYMGSPINSLSKAGFSGCGNGQYDPGSSCPAPALGSISPCVMSLNQDNTTTAINCSHSLWNMESAGSFVNGQGYNIYNSPGILSFVGQTVNNGPVSYGPLGYSNKGPVNLPAGFAGQTTRGWHMVANPFPSPISLSSAQRTAMGFDAQTQFWDSDLGNWVTPAPGATVTVAVGQAFQIRTSGGPGNFANFAVNNSHRVATTGVAFYKTEDNQDYLNVTIANGNYANTASVYFVDGATDAFDGAYDANRLFGLVDRPYVYTIEQNGEFLAYNALPLLTAGTTKSVPLSVHIGTNGNHTLTFEGIETTNATVALEDLTTGSMYPVTEGYVHTFTAQTTDNPNRFVLHFNANAVSSVAGVSGQVVNMFPNPTNDKAVVVLAQEHGFNKLTVRDISGKVILSEAINANSTSKSIDLAGMASGIYFVTLSGKQIVSQKLIKQ